MNNEDWKKISTLEDFAKMKKNGALIKYPKNGEPVDNIDLNDPTLYESYLIEEVRDLGQELDVRIKDSNEGEVIDGYHFSIGPLHKDFKQMIDEKIWWYKPTA